jgi:hypothetical protein
MQLRFDGAEADVEQPADIPAKRQAVDGAAKAAVAAKR